MRSFLLACGLCALAAISTHSQGQAAWFGAPIPQGIGDPHRPVVDVRSVSAAAVRVPGGEERFGDLVGARIRRDLETIVGFSRHSRAAGDRVWGRVTGFPSAVSTHAWVAEQFRSAGLQNVQVQAILNAGFGQGPAIVTRNYRQLGITLPFYQSHGVGSKQFIELAGPAAEGVRLPAAALLVADKLPDNDPQKKVVVDYKKTYEAKTGQPVSTFGGHMYDGLMILVEAMQRAKSADKAKVRDEIEKTKGFIGTGGVVNMSPTDHLGLDLSAFRMLEIKNGDWTLAGAGS